MAEKKTPPSDKVATKKSAPGVKAAKKLTAYMSLASKPDPLISPDGAPPPDELPRTFGGQACLDIVTAGVKAMVTAGRTETFQEFLGSLGLAEREVISESYLHFMMAEQAWQSQVPDFKLGKKGVGVVSK